MAVLAVLLIAVVLGLVSGILSRAWWHVLIAALVIAGIVEMLLFATQLTRTFNPRIFIIGAVTTSIWTAFGCLLRRAFGGFKP
jgi:hypothetical protein